MNLNDEEIERLNIARDAYLAGRIEVDELKILVAVSSAIRKWLQAPAFPNKAEFFTCPTRGYISRIDCIRFNFSGKDEPKCYTCPLKNRAWREMTERDRGVQRDIEDPVEVCCPI
jgi:hypothetical protein